jgi:hypothetical protein
MIGQTYGEDALTRVEVDETVSLPIGVPSMGTSEFRSAW